MAEESDPNIVNRLNKLPPFDEPEETPLEEPVEETPVEEPEGEITEAAAETTKEEEPTEEEALKESKQPERTKKYIDKLKSQNKELKRNILDSLIPEVPKIPQPPQAPQYPQSPVTNVIPDTQQYPGMSKKQINETFKGLVDENGYVDTGLLIETLTGLQEQNRLAAERANQAEQKSQQAVKNFDDFQRNQIMRNVHDRYPTLNPENDEFDEKLWKFVRNEVVDQWMNGKPTDVMAAAEEGMRVIYPNDMKKVDKEKKEAAERAKKNINALGASNKSQRETYTDHDELVRATQLGRKGALAERLRRAGM
jgi:hypothetical protein